MSVTTPDKGGSLPLGGPSAQTNVLQQQRAQGTRMDQMEKVMPKKEDLLTDQNAFLGKYPSLVHVPTEKDRQMQLASRYMQSEDPSAKNTRIMLDEGTRQWLVEKDKQAAAVDFERYILNTMQKQGGAGGRFNQDVYDSLQSVYPELVEKRRQYINTVADVQKMLAKMKLQQGPRTRDEWVLQYMIDTGKITVPDVAVHKIMDGGLSVDANAIKGNYTGPVAYMENAHKVPKATWFQQVAMNPEYTSTGASLYTKTTGQQ